MHKQQETKVELVEPLTTEETKFLNMISSGMTLKKIVETMPLSGMYHAKILKISICYKLQAKNMTEAVRNAVLLENILKLHP